MFQVEDIKNSKDLETAHQTVSRNRQRIENEEEIEFNQIMFCLDQANITHDDSRRFVYLKFTDKDIAELFTNLLLQLGIENLSEPGRAQKINVNEQIDEFLVQLKYEEYELIQKTYSGEMKQFGEHSPSLLLAAMNGQLETIQKLLQKSASLEEKDNYGNTTLLLAAANGRTETVQWLLQNTASSVEEKNKYGNTALLVAAANGRTETVQWLLQNTASSIAEKNLNGNTALVLAAANGHTETVQWLLQNTKSSVEEKNKYGNTALLVAAAFGRTETVQWLLQNTKSSVEERNEYGNTVLLQAAANGRTETVQWLLQNTASSIAEKNLNGNTALLVAAADGQTETVQWLLQNTKSSIAEKNLNGNTALILAAENGHKETVQWLLQNTKSSIAEKNLNGNTALLQAAANGHTETVQWLLQNTASSLEEKTEHGSTALGLAAVNGHTETVQWLLQNIASSLEEKNKYGNTALLVAAAFGRTETVQWLLQNGGSLQKTTNNNLSALQVVNKEWSGRNYAACKTYLIYRHMLIANNYRDFYNHLIEFSKLTQEEQTDGLNELEQFLNKAEMPSQAELEHIVSYCLYIIWQNEKSALKTIAQKWLYIIGHYSFISIQEPLNSNVEVNFNLFDHDAKRKLALLCLSSIEATEEIINLRYQLLRSLLKISGFTHNTTTDLQTIAEHELQNSPKHLQRFYHLIYKLLKLHHKLTHALIITPIFLDVPYSRCSRHIVIPPYFANLEKVRQTTWLSTLTPKVFYQIAAWVLYRKERSNHSRDLEEICIRLGIHNRALSYWRDVDFTQAIKDNYPILMAAEMGNQESIIWLIENIKEQEIILTRNAKKQGIFEILSHFGHSTIEKELRMRIHSSFTEFYDHICVMGQALSKESAKDRYAENPYKFDINQYHEQTKETLACLAARLGCEGIIAWLIEKKADFALTDTNGNTPLMLAVLENHFDLAAWMFEQTEVAWGIHIMNNQQNKVLNIISEKDNEKLLLMYQAYRRSAQARQTVSGSCLHLGARKQGALFTAPILPGQSSSQAENRQNSARHITFRK